MCDVRGVDLGTHKQRSERAHSAQHTLFSIHIRYDVEAEVESGRQNFTCEVYAFVSLVSSYHFVSLVCTLVPVFALEILSFSCVYTI